jgi:energy-converting hydrogenase Eha subunit C
MNKIISLALLVGGIILIVYGANASDSIGSSFSRFFTGSPTDKAIWMLIGGAAAAIFGAAGLVLRGPKTP